MKLKMNEVSYKKTFNLGEFQSETIELTGVLEVDEGGNQEDPVEAVRHLRKLVYNASEYGDRQKKSHQ